jgi:hypothetical protein
VTVVDALFPSREENIDQVVHELVATRLHRIERLGRRKARGFFRRPRRRRIVRDACVWGYSRDMITHYVLVSTNPSTLTVFDEADFRAVRYAGQRGQPFNDDDARPDQADAGATMAGNLAGLPHDPVPLHTALRPICTCR